MSIRNQVRAGLYLLVRNFWFKAALVFVVIMQAYRAWAWAQGTTYGLQDSILVTYRVFLVCTAMAVGVAHKDRKGGALRSACLAEHGRRNFVASRFIVMFLAIAAVCGLAILLDALFLATPISLLAMAPAMNSPARLLAQFLTILAYAELAQAVTWAAGAAAGFVAGSGYLGLVGALLTAVFGSQAFVGAILELQLSNNLGHTVVFDMATRLLPLDPLQAYLEPFVYLGLTWVFGRLVLARKTV